MSTFRTLLAIALLGAALVAGAADRVNLNTADAQALAAGMDGIGPSKAQAIVEWREQNGPFRSVDDLLLVRGIGQSTLDKNRERVTAASP